MIYYQRETEAVLDYIEKHLDSDLSLKVLSDVSGFSPYHFHRIFHAYMGKSLHQYIIERKLNCCASKLLYENCDITAIAMDFGFATPSAFSKSFKEQFGCTPTQYKESKNRRYPVEFAKITYQKFLYNEELEMNFSSIMLPDLPAACIGVTGLSETWENVDIEKAYYQLFKWIHEKGMYSGSMKICGITVDTPEVMELSSCRYYACATAVKPMCDENITFKKFQTSGQYVSCKLNRNTKNFAEIFFKNMDYLYGYYMISHNLSPDYRPFVEFYEKAADDEITINFCVPVKVSKK